MSRTNAKNTTVFTLDVPQAFTAGALSDLLCTVVEGNWMSSAWARFDSAVDYDTGPHGSLDYARRVAEELGLDGPGYCWLPLLPGCAVTIHEYDETTNENVASHRLDLEAVKRGLERMAVSAQKHLFGFINDDYDIVTADVFLQMALLGEIRYG